MDRTTITAGLAKLDMLGAFDPITGQDAYFIHLDQADAYKAAGLPEQAEAYAIAAARMLED